MMHDKYVDEAANSLRRVVDAFREEHPAPAYGGLWALAGFSLQAGIFLLHFYRNLTLNRSLPSIEELSDILCPVEGQISLVMQVKRTLTRATLAKALKEFALIIRLIQDRKETALLKSLRFQVACGKREANVEWPWPSDAALADGIRHMLGELERHQADPFIVEQADPLEDLWALLWSQGIRDPQAIIRYAAGRLLESFGRRDLAAAVHHDLISYFANAPRRIEGPRTGHLVLPEDVASEANAESSHKIIVGGGFGFRELRQGCFRHRPLIFADLWTNFAQWLSQAESRILEREIPVFWIDGRSGEGKSVLLRQLVAHLLLRHPDRLPVVEVSREELPQAVKERREVLDQPALLIVDDLYAVANREEWDERVSQAVETDLAPVSILTCGPTEQREEFERRFSEPLQVTRFTVPPFRESERQEFVDWFTHRTGKEPDQKALTTENALLVQLIFELSEGTTLNEFARRFHKRLGSALPAVQRILSLSALYLETPLDLLAQTDERDVINRLSQDDQHHFQLGAESVNFAHAHLAGEMLRPILEKSYSRISWEIAWARELAAVLAVPSDRLPAYIHGNVVARLVRTPRLNVAERARALKELYELHVAENQGAPAGYLLPYWLSALVLAPDISLSPSPIDYACSVIALPEVSDQFPPRVALNLWQLKDRTQLTSEDLSQACWGFLLRTANRYPEAPTVVGQFLRASSPQDVYRQRAIEWLDNNAEHPHAYQLLAPLLASAPTDEEMRRRTLNWLDNNPQHPQAAQPLVALIANAPNDERVQSQALKWLDNNPQHPHAGQPLAVLIACAPNDERVRNQALNWLDNNPQHPQAGQPLAALIARAPNDERVRNQALNWLDNNPQHPQAGQPVAALIAYANDERVRSQALKWLGNNPQHPQAGQPLAVPIACAPNDERVRSQALKWLGNNPQHPQAGVPLTVLVSGAPNDEKIRSRALEWLDNTPYHPQAHNVLAALVSGAPSDEEIRSRALKWLDNNPHHSQAYNLLAALVAGAPTDENIRSRALKWLDNNLQHPQLYNLLMSLVSGAPSDEEIRSRALKWLDKNAQHGQVYNLLAAFVASAPTDEEIRTRALEWLDKNPQHPEIAQMLSVLIARSPDEEAEDWIRKGMDFIQVPERKGCASVLATTLVRSKARHNIIDYALRLAASVLKNQRGFILHNLSRACTYNPSSALSYISSCPDQQRRRQVSLALARGILKYEARLPDLVAALEVHPPVIAFEVLSQCLRNGISTPEFMAYLAQALKRGFRQTGYHAFLQALHQYPVAWKAVEPELYSVIKEDFDRTSAKSRSKER